MSSFIDAVEQRARELAHSNNWYGEAFITKFWLQALTEVLAAAEPVAWFEKNESLGAWFLAYSYNPNAETQPLFTAPVADDRDARIAELEAEVTHLNDWAVQYHEEMRKRYLFDEAERNGLRTKLSAAQAAMQSALKWCPENGQAERILNAAIAAGQSAAGSEAA